MSSRDRRSHDWMGAVCISSLNTLSSTAEDGRGLPLAFLGRYRHSSHGSKQSSMGIGVPIAGRYVKIYYMQVTGEAEVVPMAELASLSHYRHFYIMETSICSQRHGVFTRGFFYCFLLSL